MQNNCCCGQHKKDDDDDEDDNDGNRKADRTTHLHNRAPLGEPDVPNKLN